MRSAAKIQKKKKKEPWYMFKEILKFLNNAEFVISLSDGLKR